MKKYLSLCLIAFALCISTQDMMAQNRIEIDRAANQKTKTLRKTLKFDSTKMEDVYEAYKAYELIYQNIDNNLEKNTERLKEINNRLDEKLKGILTEEQFELYLNTYRSS
ncbi:hypothetical protein ESY86_01805 [Subsaximicrobium wynnwilliamsii]|uniref:Uncharacterized protein n=1 Tax=Subsaximicrobium wynnwilliamsii TaxID=291179 RepID=A0A5C6ZLQ5_9FLAO|nr:hypothetical protein [Subsaximicrobium wynnwilliamsii]TXD85370.1 hypothetical protein ESY87_00115 [Subsaximicrobium wynnwilliamsii]TXD90722.1 hypothetical protein ESY86_01805 [Subsaximicrobium wynnwilliamsii]TXE05230.1 hypothetical protein ESY88_00115 [Subsaximicrobium wynnwilliamsii]